jgi:hypothetical protein
MVATSASTNFRPYELPSAHASDAQLDELALQRAFFFSRMHWQRLLLLVLCMMTWTMAFLFLLYMRGRWSGMQHA